MKPFSILSGATEQILSFDFFVHTCHTLNFPQPWYWLLKLFKGFIIVIQCLDLKLFPIFQMSLLIFKYIPPYFDILLLSRLQLFLYLSQTKSIIFWSFEIMINPLHVVWSAKSFAKYAVAKFFFTIFAKFLHNILQDFWIIFFHNFLHNICKIFVNWFRIWTWGSHLLINAHWTQYLLFSHSFIFTLSVWSLGAGITTNFLLSKKWLKKRCVMLFSRRGRRMRDWQPLLILFFCTFWKINSAQFLQKVLPNFCKIFEKNVQNFLLQIAL